MSRKLLAAYLLVVLLPLGALAWLSARLAAAEVQGANARAQGLAREALSARDAGIHELLEERRRWAMEAMATPSPDRDALREIPRRLPFVRQAFRTEPGGRLVYPSLLDDLDREEAAFLRRTATLWTAGGLVAGEGKGSARDEAGRGASGTARGWHAWHGEDGLRVLCWWRDAEGGLRGAELDRMRLLSDIVGELPDADTLVEGRFRLLDAQGGVLHQWGPYTPGPAERPLAREALSPPLGAWSLDYFGPGAPARSGLASLTSGAIPWLSGVAVLVLGLAMHVYRESTRELREAAQRVTFVNQVSHELKTPLTNIRMYAELLQAQVEEVPEAGRHADIIVSESQRLSRLIGNVLTFGRSQRHELSIRRRPAVVDEVVARVIEHFRPALAARGVAVETELGAPGSRAIDPDAIEQVLGNLLSNVEKYAATGGLARVTTRADGRRVTISVTDHGPGIPDLERERVFEPFHRISHALTEGVAGTGIGLTIARDLARLHGGDLRLVPGGPGACFAITLDAEEAS